MSTMSTSSLRNQSNKEATQDDRMRLTRIDFSDRYIEKVKNCAISKSFYALSYQIGVFQILLIILRKCEQSLLGEVELQNILAKSDSIDKRPQRTIAASKKRTWLRLVLDEILAMDLNGQYCQLMSMNHLWRYNPSRVPPSQVQHSDLTLLHYFIGSCYQGLIQNVFVNEKNLDLGVVCLEPNFSYTLESLEDSTRKFFGAVVQILKIWPTSITLKSAEEDENIKKDPIELSKGLLVGASESQKGSLPSTTIQTQFEVIGRIIVSDYLARTNKTLAYRATTKFPVAHKCLETSNSNRLKEQYKASIRSRETDFRTARKNARDLKDELEAIKATLGVKADWSIEYIKTPSVIQLQPLKADQALLTLTLPARKESSPRIIRKTGDDNQKKAGSKYFSPPSD